MTMDSCTCPYKYGGITVQAEAYPPWMHELSSLILNQCRANGWPEGEAKPNCCNANLYEGGQHACGWHSDNEPLWGEGDTIIISLSLGTPRKFKCRMINRRLKEEDPAPLVLGDGDLCVMAGAFQRHLEHMVPFENSVEGVRINLTFRYLIQHTNQCEYYSQQVPRISTPQLSGPQYFQIH